MAISSAEVVLLFPNDNLSLEQVDHFVEDANLLVDELLAVTTLSSSRKDIIAKYLAAHFYVLAGHEGGIFEEKIGESSEKRGSTFTLGQGLRLTRWGQMVLSLDTTGVFKEQMDLGTHSKKAALFRLV